VAKERLKSPRARLFVALDLPAELRRAIAEWQRAELTDPALRPVRPESLHLTLIFLGYRPEKEIDRIAEAALGLEATTPTIELAPEPIGVPRGKRPRLFALDTPSEGAVALQARVERRLVEGGFYKPEKRPFWPHLTVARVKPEKRGGRKPALVEKPPGPVAEHTFLFFRPVPLVRLVLFRSHLRREGALYEPMAELELPTGETTER
jgi:RNA 2',3'-cyclic 3'-phosphodiesterase